MDRNKKNQIFLIPGVFLGLFWALLTKPAHAQAATPTDLGEFEGLGPLGEIIKNLTSQDVATPLGLLNKVLSILIGIITGIAFIYFIFLFFAGALSWTSSGGDPKSIEKAQKQISTAIIGLIVVVAAIFISQLLGSILGFDILNPLGFIVNIWT